MACLFYDILQRHRYDYIPCLILSPLWACYSVLLAVSASAFGLFLPCILERKIALN